MYKRTRCFIWALLYSRTWFSSSEKYKNYIIMHPGTRCFPLATNLLFYLTIFISTTVSTNQVKFGIRLYDTMGRFKQTKRFCGYSNIMSIIKIWKYVLENIAPTFLSDIKLPRTVTRQRITLFNKTGLQIPLISMMNDLKITVSVTYIPQRSFWSQSHPFLP